MSVNGTETVHYGVIWVPVIGTEAVHYGFFLFGNRSIIGPKNDLTIHFKQFNHNLYPKVVEYHEKPI